MALNRSGEILRCMGRSFESAFLPRLLVRRQDHGLHVRDAILGEEHVLGAAQADAVRAELAGGFGVARECRRWRERRNCRGIRRPSA